MLRDAGRRAVVGAHEADEAAAQPAVGDDHRVVTTARVTELRPADRHRGVACHPDRDRLAGRVHDEVGRRPQDRPMRSDELLGAVDVVLVAEELEALEHEAEVGRLLARHPLARRVVGVAEDDEPDVRVLAAGGLDELRVRHAVGALDAHEAAVTELLHDDVLVRTPRLRDRRGLGRRELLVVDDRRGVAALQLLVVGVRRQGLLRDLHGLLGRRALLPPDERHGLAAGAEGERGVGAATVGVDQVVAHLEADDAAQVIAQAVEHLRVALHGAVGEVHHLVEVDTRRRESDEIEQLVARGIVGGLQVGADGEPVVAVPDAGLDAALARGLHAVAHLIAARLEERGRGVDGGLAHRPDARVAAVAHGVDEVTDLLGTVEGRVFTNGDDEAPTAVGAGTRFSGHGISRSAIVHLRLRGTESPKYTF